MATIIKTEATYVTGGKRPFKSISHMSDGTTHVKHFASKAAAVAAAKNNAKHWNCEMEDNVWEPAEQETDLTAR